MSPQNGKTPRNPKKSREGIEGGEGSSMASVCEIIPGFLYLSAVHAAQDIKILQSLQITHILNLTGPHPITKKPRYPNKFPTKFSYLHICLLDGLETDIKAYTGAGHDFIDKAAQQFQQGTPSGKEGKKPRVLVHCQAGISRSATCVITYLMRRRGMRLRAAYELVKKKKPNIGPNKSFFRQCIDLDRALFLREGDKDAKHRNESISLPQYLAHQMISEGGVLYEARNHPKISRAALEKDLSANGCDTGATLQKYLSIAFSS